MPPDISNPSASTQDTQYDSEPPERLSVEVVIEHDGWDAVGDLEDATRAAAGAVASLPAMAEQLPASACIAFTSDAAVRTLNGTYRGKAAPTNVLSFPAPEPVHVEPGCVSFLGDVILARETVLREAREQGLVPRHHVQHLVVHGLLHLMGCDHETDHEAQVMEALEIEALAGIGVANPYAGFE